MTDTPSRPTASRKTRRSISLAPDPLADTPPAPPAPEPVAPPAKKARARKPAAVAAEPPATITETAKPKPPAKPKSPARAKPVEPEPEAEVTHTPLNPDAKPGEEYPGEPTTKMTINIPLSLHRRASGLVAHAQFTGNPEGIRSLTDLVRDAINLAVTKAEVDLNDGDPFHPPTALRRGRRVTL